MSRMYMIYIFAARFVLDYARLHLGLYWSERQGNRTSEEWNDEVWSYIVESRTEQRGAPCTFYLTQYIVSWMSWQVLFQSQVGSILEDSGHTSLPQLIKYTMTWCASSQCSQPELAVSSTYSCDGYWSPLDCSKRSLFTRGIAGSIQVTHSSCHRTTTKINLLLTQV